MPFTAKQHSRTTLRQRCNTFWCLISVLVVGSFLTGAILHLNWRPQPDKDPRIQTQNTSLHLNIPKDVHYTYICLHHDDWSECIQLNQMLRGNMTFKITAERTISEAHHDSSKSTIAIYSTVGCVCAFLVLYTIYIIWNCECLQNFNLGTTTACCRRKRVHVMAAPPPQTASSPVIPLNVSSRVKKVQHSCAVNIISQIDPSFDAGPEFIGSVDGHVKELEAKIKASNCSSEEPLKPRTYDCFIIYSREDEDIVYNKLIPFLISNNIKYCEHQEHFELGKNIFDNVNTCITQSRRVVAVLSKSFFASGYCMMDLDAVRGYAASNGYSVQDFLISIKITNFVFPNKYNDMSNSTYADLSEDVNDERKWLQIRKALTEFRLASVVMRIEMDAKNRTPKLRLPVSVV